VLRQLCVGAKGCSPRPGGTFIIRPRGPTSRASTAAWHLAEASAGRHSILVADWHILDVEGMTYHEQLGADWFDRRNDPVRRARLNMLEFRKLGCDLSPNPDGTLTVSIPAA